MALDVLEGDMSKHVRYVVNHPDGWAVKAGGSIRATSVHDTQSQAIAVAKMAVTSRGGGEVRIQGLDCGWQDSEIITPGIDPFPPRDNR